MYAYMCMMVCTLGLSCFVLVCIFVCIGVFVCLCLYLLLCPVTSFDLACSVLRPFSFPHSCNMASHRADESSPSELASDWICVQPHWPMPMCHCARLWQYAYTNLDLAADGKAFTCPIYLMHRVDERNKVVPGSCLVSFHARQGPTPWHGSWHVEGVTREGSVLHLSFNARGPNDNNTMHTTIMWPATLCTPGFHAGDWMGMDYASRKIDMHFQRYLEQNGNGWKL